MDFTGSSEMPGFRKKEKGKRRKDKGNPYDSGCQEYVPVDAINASKAHLVLR
jgi:hypothetical protein